MPETTEKAELMRSMNDGIGLFAAGSTLATDDSAPSAAGDGWTFACECGAADCDEWVELELAEYEQVRAAPDPDVLAVGHVASSSSQRARREAEQTRDSSRALRAQAKEQQQRTQRLRDETS